MSYSNTNIKAKTVIMLSMITVFVIFGIITYNNHTTANDIELNDKQVILTYPKKSINIDHQMIDEVKITCADKGGGCGLVFYVDNEQYHTKYFTDSDGAQKIRDDINGRIEKF